MSPSLDLSGAKDRGDADWVPVPAGNYRATIENAEMGETKGGEGAKLPAGTPLLNIRFSIDEEDMPSDDLLPPAWEDDDGNEHTPIWSKSAFKGFPLAPKKYEKKQDLDNILYAFLKAVGYDADELKSGTFDLDLEDLPGRGCVLALEPREYNGRKNNNVRYITEIGTSETQLI